MSITGLLDNKQEDIRTRSFSNSVVVYADTFIVSAAYCMHGSLPWRLNIIIVVLSLSYHRNIA